MNSRIKRFNLKLHTTAATSALVAVVAGFAELNTGQDRNTAQMIWFFFVLSSGFLIQLAGSYKYSVLITTAIQPAAAFLAVLLAGAYFYGITQFSAMEWDVSVASSLRVLVLLAVTTIMIALVAQAGPLLSNSIEQILKLSPERASQIALTIGAVGSVISALVILYKLMVLQHGIQLPK